MMRNSPESVARIKSKIQHVLLFSCALMIAGCGSQVSTEPSPTASATAFEDSEKALALAYRGCVGPIADYAYEGPNEVGWMGIVGEYGLNEGVFSDEWLESNSDGIQDFMTIYSYLSTAQQSAAILDPMWKPLAESYVAAGRDAVNNFKSGSNIGEAVDSISSEYITSYDAICRIASSKAIEAATSRGLSLTEWTDKTAGELLPTLPEDWGSAP